MISVLFVDDEPVLLDIGRIYLERTGTFTVTTVESARDALEAMEKKNYDVVVSDYEMPRMNGITLLKEIRESGNDIPYILFTGRGREEVASEALNSGADFYIQKGGDPRAQFNELEHKILKAFEKRQALYTLRESERRMADIINFLPDATFAIDIDGKVIAWNREMERLTRISANEMIGKGDHEYSVVFYKKRRKLLVDLALSPDPDLEASYPEFSREGDLVIADNVITTLFDSPRYFRARASVLYNRDGKPAGAIESLRDMTDQKMTELTLMESEEKFRAVADYTLDWEYWDNSQQGIIYMSSSCERITGYPVSSFIENPELLNEIVHPEDKSGWTLHREVVDIGKKGEEIDFRIITRDGEVRWISHICAPVISSSGKYLGHRASNRDITARVRSEEVLRESRGRIRKIIKYLPVGLLIYRFNPDGRIILSGSNPAADQILGTDLSSFLGKEIFEIFPGIELSLLLEKVRWVMRTAETWSVDAIRLDDQEIVEIYEIHAFQAGPELVVIAFQDITERLTNRLDLTASELRYRELFENMLTGAAVFETPDNGDSFFFKDYNKAGQLMDGRKKEEVIGRNVEDVFPGVAAFGLLEVLKRVYLSGIPEHIPPSRYEDENLYAWRESYVYRLASGEVVSMYTDVTGTHIAEEELKASEEKYRRFVESAKEGILVGQNGTIRFANSRLCEILATPLEKIIGAPLFGSIHPEDKDELIALYEQYPLGDCHLEEPVRVIDSKGEIHWLDYHATQIMWEGSAGMLAFLTDITCLIAARNAMQESEQFLSDVINFLPDPTFAIDTEGKIIFWNQAMEEMTGVRSDEVLGKGDQMHGYAVYGEKKPMLIDLIDSPEEYIREYYPITYHQPGRLVGDNWVMVKGEVRGLWGKATLLRNSNGEVIGAIESIRDTTEIKRAGEALIIANKKLNLLSGITRHDVRNQLTSLFGYLDLIHDESGDPGLNEMLEKISHLAWTISRQIEFTAEYQEIGVKSPVYALIETLFQGAASGITAEGVSFHLSCGGYEILADPLIDRVFYNLLDNAVRHATGLTCVSCICHEDGSDLLIGIKDDGSGIADDQKERIFDRGFGTGSGMGLFLVREILAITGITIHETGMLGAGALFEIRVPPSSFREKK